MSKGQRNAIKAVPFTDHEPLCLADSAYNVAILKGWKLSKMRSHAADQLQTAQEVSGYLLDWLVGLLGLLCWGGMDTETWRGEARETPMAAPACSNKTQSCDAWAEVCFSVSGTWQGC